MEYSNNDLAQLHSELTDILREIVRICELLKIDYFIQGGTAIGAFYNNGIIPWDDDIDIGMTRENYSRFIKEAPSVINQNYFVQCFETEPDTPFYFVKVRKNHTLFLEEPYKNLNIHHGIFVDIFPYDNVPDSAIKEKIHRRIVNYFDGCFKRSLLMECVRESVPSFLRPISGFISKIWFSLLQIVPRKWIYASLCKVQSWYNANTCKYVSIVKMPMDQIASKDVLSLKDVIFEGIVVKEPNNVEVYLRHHYPHLQPVPPKEYQVNHAPLKLMFSNDGQ